MNAYYNENDPRAVAWLRELLSDGLVAPGDVDERSIKNVHPNDFAGYTQCHFFAGIGGWSYALRLAGWPDDRPVWTGSCPCQPFSVAGRRAGTDDIRHLWPEFGRLIGEFRPTTVFGEQVSGKDGRAWLAGVRSDLEAAEYAVGAADLCAAGVGAPHIRQRLYWLADAEHAKRWTFHEHRQNGRDGQNGGRAEAYGEPGACGEVCDMAAGACVEHDGAGGARNGRIGSANNRADRHLGNGDISGLQGWHTGERAGERITREASLGVNPWSGGEWHVGTDGLARFFESGILPLAYGVSGGMVRGRDSGAPFDVNTTTEARVMRIHGYGNAIVPQVAVEFIGAYMDVKSAEVES